MFFGQEIQPDKNLSISKPMNEAEEPLQARKDQFHSGTGMD